MRKINWIIALVIAVGITAGFNSCKKDKDDDDNTTLDPTPTVTEVTGEISANTTWSASNKYLLKGFVYVTNGATLTIEAGTVIKGDKTTMGTLIIEQGGKIMAEGTAAKPIVFTSNAPVNFRNRGDWGGLIICGKAPINVSGGTAQIEGGPRSTYGGTDVADNSGILKYVRVEYAGYPFQPDKEINGITFGGVGNGTTVDYVQVSYSNDDSYEFFGGTVNCKHLIAVSGLDDDFDTDYGYSGKLQFVVSLRDKGVADVSGSNSFESDNDGSGSSSTPFTSAIFSNVSIFGPRQTATTSNISSLYKYAMHLKKNTHISIFNSIFVGWTTGLMVDGSACETNATNGDTEVKNCIISGCSSFFSQASGSTFSTKDWYQTAAFNNDTLLSNSSVMITDPWAATPNFLPATGSPALTDADFTNPKLTSGFEAVSYRGAFGSTDWTSSWANWSPQTTEY